jgi:hypothetical protein
MIPSKMDTLMRFNFGGSPGKPPAPPKIPTPQDAARNLDSPKKPRGYASTLLGGMEKSANAEQSPGSGVLKTLLGE